MTFFRIIFFPLLFLAQPVWAQSNFRVPHSLASGRSDFVSRGLLESCYSIALSDISMGRPCNPAFLGLHQEEKFLVHAFVGNNVRYVADALEVINYKASTSTFRRLFNQSSDAEFEGDLELYYSKDDWTLSFSPSRVTYYSLIRNRVLPYISVYASQEHIARAQKAWTVTEDFYVGLQARAVVRKFLFSEFFVADAVVEDSDLLKTRYQSVLYLEPGFLWTPRDTEWEPQLSATVTQLGVNSRHYKHLPHDPEGEIGVSVKSVLGSGNLRFGPHVSLNRRSDRWEEHIRFSGVYEIEPVQIVGSFKINQGNAGVYYQRERFNGGLIYDVQYIENLQASDELLHTWYAQLGYEI